MNNSIVQFDNIVKQYESISVLKGVSASINPGEIIAVLGKNGAGKTTLMEALLGFVPIESGSIKVFDQTPVEFKDGVKNRIGYVPQQDDLLPHITVDSWLKLISAFYDNWDRALQENLLLEWEIPRDKRINKLSVGQRQKVCIISGICHRPELLLLDEPVASLDPIARRQFLATLITLTREHAPAILFSTHIVSDVERIASRIWIMREGEIVVDSELDALKERFVRLHGNAAAIAEFGGQLNVVKSRDSGAQQTHLVSNWNEAYKANTTATVEHLNLEDIFVELHQ